MVRVKNFGFNQSVIKAVSWEIIESAFVQTKKGQTPNYYSVLLFVSEWSEALYDFLFIEWKSLVGAAKKDKNNSFKITKDLSKGVKEAGRKIETQKSFVISNWKDYVPMFWFLVVTGSQYVTFAVKEEWTGIILKESASKALSELPECSQSLRLTSGHKAPAWRDRSMCCTMLATCLNYSPFAFKAT